MTDNPLAVVSEFFALFGPSHEQMTAAAQRYAPKVLDGYLRARD